METCISSMLDTNPISNTTYDLLRSTEGLKTEADVDDEIKIYVKEDDGIKLDVDEDDNDAPIMTCIFCNSVFHCLESLAEHMRQHTVPDKVEVDLEETDSRNQVTRYSRSSETLPKFYICDECGRSFSLACNLKAHMRTHRGERPFQCTECDRCFSSKTNMLTHFRTHSGVRPFSCVQCDKTFTQIGSLKVHHRTHTGERPYGCEECDRQFTKASDLRRHTKTHYFDKPFKCCHCPRSFLDSNGLKMHLRRHSNYRPYSCFVCDKKFTRVVCLKNHLRLHDHWKKSDNITIIGETGIDIGANMPVKIHGGAGKDIYRQCRN